MVFQCINIRQVPWEVLKTAAFGLRWKTMFDPYNISFWATGRFSQGLKNEFESVTVN